MSEKMFVDAESFNSWLDVAIRLFISAIIMLIVCC